MLLSLTLSAAALGALYYSPGPGRPSPGRALRSFDARYQRLVAEHLDARLTAAARREQIAQGGLEPSPRERRVNRQIALSGAAVGAGALGLAGAPGMAALATAGVAVVLAPTIGRYALQSWRERRLKYRAFGPAMRVSAAAMGFYLAAAVMALVYVTALKLSERTGVSTRAALRAALDGGTPRRVWVRRDGVEIETPLEQVAAGDLVVVDAGRAIPVDGVVVEGEGAVDQQSLTGESRPVEKQSGAPVMADAILLRGRLCIRVERAGAETAAARRAAMLEAATRSSEAAADRGERNADATVTPIVAASGAGVVVLGLEEGLSITQAGLGSHAVTAGPLCTLTHLNLASQRGVLVKTGAAFEALCAVDTVVFDKTGTLTLAQPEAAAIFAAEPWTERDILRFAALAEHRQTHPVALAILAEAAARGIAAQPPEQAAYTVGRGIRVEAEGRVLHVGSRRFLRDQGALFPPEVEGWRAQVEAEGGSLAFVAVDGRCAGAVALRDRLRDGARELVAALRARGVAMRVLSGDAEAPTREIARTLGLDGFHAQALPEEKAALIAGLQREGRTVCFVGDGMNDALALRQADVSVSFQGASRLASAAADVVLVDESLSSLEALFDLAGGFDRALDRTLAIGNVSGIALIGGVVVLGFGMTAAVALYLVGLGAAVGGALRPDLLARADLENLDRALERRIDHWRAQAQADA